MQVLNQSLKEYNKYLTNNYRCYPRDSIHAELGLESLSARRSVLGNYDLEITFFLQNSTRSFFSLPDRL